MGYNLWISLVIPAIIMETADVEHVEFQTKLFVA